MTNFIQMSRTLAAAGLVLVACVVDVICTDFNSTYRDCVKSRDELIATAVRKYDRCFSSPPDFIPSCATSDIGKCVSDLADDIMFQKCIGSTNLETLGAVARVLHAQTEYSCSEAGQNATEMFIANDGPQCSVKHKDETLLCFSNAKYPILGRPISRDPDSLAGFAVNEEYCKVLKHFDACEMAAIADCHEDVLSFTSVSHDVRWKASECQDIINAGSHMLSSLVTITAVTLLGGFFRTLV